MTDCGNDAVAMMEQAAATTRVMIVVAGCKYAARMAIPGAAQCFGQIVQEHCQQPPAQIVCRSQLSSQIDGTQLGARLKVLWSKLLAHGLQKAVLPYITPDAAILAPT